MIFLANIEYSETEGIFKKIRSQAMAISRIKGECFLVCKKNKLTHLIKFNNNKLDYEETFKNGNLLNNTIEILNRNKKNSKSIYIRHMIPSIELIKLLKVAKKESMKIYYEIPTYPYFGEQFKNSSHKIRTGARLGLDLSFWPIIYNYIDKLIIVKSSSTVKLFSKMICITNGIDASKIKSKKVSEHSNKEYINLVGIGTIYKYHGYERIINGLYDCGGIVDNKKVRFHIIGESREIDNLKNLSIKLGLNDIVYFHGKKKSEELDEIFEDMDIGIGCLALFRRNADIDTTLKVVEYFSRGLPVVSSGEVPKINGKELATIKVSNTSENISIEKIYKEYTEIKVEDLAILSTLAKETFDWENIFTKVLS